MMFPRSIIPNAFTSLNLAFGVLSIIKATEKDYFSAGILIMLAVLADACDGRAARYFGVSGDFGKELDSLCDVVSFGVSPAILIYQMYLYSANTVYLVFVIIYAVCAALRLARFNLDAANVQGYFMGLPSPGAACFLASAAIAGLEMPPACAAAGLFVSGLLMYSKVRYPDFKGKGNPIKPPVAVLCSLAAGYILYFSPTLASIPFIIIFAFLAAGVINFFYIHFTGGYD
ncbi:MAG: CDP-diacylglycerol--serine O-phosphatidyltransferase [Acidaminococcales bacterium]|jgi:CDP-diacylglycerol--serine O-phosphatidyltransferase|nr:CDP-diacylglycerol--serine O-phosphatidyltransferase [Acidaminococcales bacterium]